MATAEPNTAAESTRAGTAYRREIDGLRAIAVVVVILYHARPFPEIESMFSGGYVGVDIFFVISGFLITRSIVHQLDAGNFSIWQFYERRARRILPALLTVVAVSVPVAIAVLSRTALYEFAGSVLSSIFFSSNVFFWLQDSYSAEPSQLKPLLHTWSLSVEEQFYLLYPPLMLLLAWLSARKRLIMLSAILIASLGLAQFLAPRQSNANFFLAPTRAWELLFGAILALTAVAAVPRHNRATRYLPTVGLAGIAFAVVTFTDATLHPSVRTLIPVVGTVLVIAFANPSDPATILLSTRLAVGIGLISYSLYLWHFPILAFGRVAFAETYGSADIVLWIGLSFVLAALTWRFVEQPFRNASQVTVRQLALTCLALVVALSTFAGVTLSQGSERALEADPADIARTFGVWEDPAGVRPQCVDQQDFLSPAAWCVLGSETSALDFILVGDSHAHAQAAIFHEAASELGLHGVLISRSGCPTLLDLEPQRGAPLSQDCLDVADAALAFAIEEQVSRVIMASRWNYYTCGERLAFCGFTQNVRFRDGDWADSIAARLRYLDAALTYTAQEYTAAGIGLTFLAEVPRQQHDPREIYEQHLSFPSENKLETMALRTADHRSFTEDTRRLLDDVAAQYAGVEVADESTVLCEPDGVCAVGTETSSFYSDDGHLGVGAPAVLKDWAIELMER